LRRPVKSRAGLGPECVPPARDGGTHSPNALPEIPGYGFLATPHQAVTWGGPATPGSGRHLWGWTTPGSSNSSPSKNRVIAARSRMVAFGPLIRSFTARETEVLTLVGQGLANKQIAARLGCSSRTVEKHLESLLRKAQARSRTELVALTGPQTEAADPR